MTEKQYLAEVSVVLRRSGMPGKIRKRLEADLASDFSARLERGETAGEIVRSMGAPENLAAEFIAENGGVKVRTPAEKALLICGVLSAVLTAAAGLYLAVIFDFAFRIQMWLNGRDAAESGQTVIGGADGPTAIFVASQPNPLLWLLFGFFLAACILCFILYARLRKNR
ncbi:hypothetical protein CAFE_29370 [Caprobacter fermentans]|uniref:DUF1700 domain-containing protein n=1 Tax=Caproicibacter fermentans TaxID=2576756 RepID=A0A6N8I2S9_9FIRM|nr:hypothetical protein [Caproicibacter fermentans]MVB12205.1 hypothetical protein [Caproicibacter fermentans]OCN01148.1 hypothetical protein A7X67_07185 [Clostridium sp. W14A]QNK39642.1 hypothetical protein HCR03_12970 [Caproicibacter fermentans]